MTGQPVTAPGLYPDLPEDLYHADPVPEGSLSVSGAKKLMPPYCPAIFHYERRHPPQPTAAMDEGSVVHGLVLGAGQHVAVIDAPDWRTKAARDAKAAAFAAGSIPMLAGDYAEACSIARAVVADELAGPVFAEGTPEVSMFWVCADTGIWCRGRMDWLTWIDGHPVIGDLKTCASASPDEVARSVNKYAYYMQDPWYRDGLGTIFGQDPDDIEFLFIFVQTIPPYLVTVARVDAKSRELGRERNRLAREKYRDCTAAGIWPAWTDDITEITLPYWTVRQIESEISNEYAYR